MNGIFQDASEYSEFFWRLSVGQGATLPEDIREVRAQWWRLRRIGVILPAEPDVILIDGGKP